MKRFVRSLALLLLPILLYYAVFAAFESNNYFGLRGDTPAGKPIGVLRAYRENPAASVIIGDSRMAYFDPDRVAQITGRRFGNLAYGGASLKENLDLLDWLLETYPQVDEIVLGLSFYTLNISYNADRFESLLQSLENPFVYLTSLFFNLEALERAWLSLNGADLGGGESERRDLNEYIYTAENGQTLDYPPFFIDYVQTISPYTSSWALNEPLFARLLATMTKCTEQGIRFVIVLPPVHSSIRELAMRPNGIDVKMQQVLDALHALPGTEVLDYELTNPLPFSDTQFYDGFHTEYDRGLPQWTDILFAEIA